MQASNLSGSEKAVGALVALLSTYGAYQGADAAKQTELNRVKIDNWRVELDEHRSVRDQMARLLAADLGPKANVAQAAAEYELAALTLKRLPKKDQADYATVLVRSMESSLADLSIQREALELQRSRGGKGSANVAETVAQQQRIVQASWQIDNVLKELRPRTQARMTSEPAVPKTDYYRVQLFVCEHPKGRTEEHIKRAEDALHALQATKYPRNQTGWTVHRARELSEDDQKALTTGNHVVADPPEMDFAKALADWLNQMPNGIADTPSIATVLPLQGNWQVTQQTDRRATPWYVSLRYCPGT